jgi:hypothetical protein
MSSTESEEASPGKHVARLESPRGDAERDLNDLGTAQRKEGVGHPRGREIIFADSE